MLVVSRAGNWGQVRMALFGLVLMPRRGYGNSARGFNPGNRPINGSALKGRKLTWINPTRIAPQNEFRVCLAVLETHPESLFCDDGFPAWRCTKKPIPWQIG